MERVAVACCTLLHWQFKLRGNGETMCLLLSADTIAATIRTVKN